MKIAAIGDVHCRARCDGEIRAMLDGVEREAEVLLLAGDLTHRGRVEEMEALLRELRGLGLPLIAVDGNHDHENDQAELLLKMMEGRGVHVLRGTSTVIRGVGFVGVKGFCGGFDQRRVQAFGEAAIKAFLQETVREVLSLETALERVETPRRVALLHYSPIRATLAGESPEIFPFLGSSLFADALDRHGVDLAVHAHSHDGAPEGRTPGGIPVYNVSRFVVERATGRSYRVFEV